MFACSLTVYTHPVELLEFMEELSSKNVAIINSAVFNAGFLTGGDYFDYRKTDPKKDIKLFDWRERFFACCNKFNVTPADACVQFGLSVPGVVAVALNTSKPHRIKENAESVTSKIPNEFWTVLKDEKLIAEHLTLPYR
jgi:D-threo-aldose 1-dehydrogenase